MPKSAEERAAYKREWRRRWRAENPERARERAREERARQSPEARERQRERKREWDRRQRAENPELVREKRRQRTAQDKAAGHRADGWCECLECRRAYARERNAIPAVLERKRAAGRRTYHKAHARQCACGEPVKNGSAHCAAHDFLALVDRSAGADGCWPYLGKSRLAAPDANGERYGLHSFNGRQTGAHRVAWELEHGRSPRPGYEIHHTCRRRLCVNPAHLRELSPEAHRRAHRSGRPRGWQVADQVDRNTWAAFRRRALPILWERQAGRCALCGEPVDLEAPGSGARGAAVDHVEPLMAGGELIPPMDAVRLVHKGCNSAQANRDRAEPRPDPGQLRLAV